MSTSAPTSATADPTFLYREHPLLKKRVHRLGLAMNYGIGPAGAEPAIERGINYFFWPIRAANEAVPLAAAMKRQRDKLVVAAIPSTGFLGWTIRRAAERALKLLGTDYLDIFQIGWLGRGSAWTKGVQEELLKLREEGKVRLIGTSIHDRVRAGKLAEDSPLDMLMIRYNAAHPGAERDVFPHLAKRHPFLCAYTATSWGALLKRPSGWTGNVPAAGDCYRFCLSSPHVDVALTAPANLAQLDENLAALARGPLSPDEMTWMRDFGKQVHSTSKIPFAPR